VRARIVLRIGFCILCLVLAPLRQATAQDQISFIRDAEIESIIRTWWTPIILAAGLDPHAVHIYLVNDPTLNSFVAGGQNLFLNTGTLLRSQTPNQLVGIMAHETGHIAGGHLTRDEGAMHNAMITGLIAMAASAAVAVAGHSPDVAAAGMLGAQTTGMGSFMAFSVVQEASADHAAMTFLDRAHMSARGLLEFFEILQQEELMSGEKEDPYLRDHPLTTERVQYVRDHVAHSPWSDVKDPPDWIAMHAVMVAKLFAFLNPPSMTLAKYKADDKSVPARYARAIAYYRIPQLPQALDLVNGLIKEQPDNPYFEELKGQMLFENGKVADAVAPYEHAVALKPDNALLKIELAQVDLEDNDAALVPKALTVLSAASQDESDNDEMWRLMAVGYGRSGNMGMMALSLAEQNMASGDYNAARGEAKRAIGLLPPGPQRQRAQDIADDARRSKDRGD
jgi:predicted Zn-dependent protease